MYLNCYDLCVFRMISISCLFRLAGGKWGSAGNHYRFARHAPNDDPGRTWPGAAASAGGQPEGCHAT